MAIAPKIDKALLFLGAGALGAGASNSLGSVWFHHQPPDAVSLVFLSTGLMLGGFLARRWLLGR